MIEPGEGASFVCKIESVLDLYHETYDPQRHVVCFDESDNDLHQHVRDPLPARPESLSEKRLSC
jgi:hypothetical protein